MIIEEHFKEAIAKTKREVLKDEFTHSDQQHRAIFNLVLRKDIFAQSGKSLISQMAPAVILLLRGNRERPSMIFQRNTTLIIICPLNSLIDSLYPLLC